MRIKRIVYAIFLWCSFYTATAQVPSNVPTNGLVGYWPFSGNANDEGGNGNNGTVSGATLTTDRNGNANSAYLFNPTVASNINLQTQSVTGIGLQNIRSSISTKPLEPIHWKHFHHNGCLSNPFVSTINFQFSQPIEGPSSVYLFDVRGRLIFTAQRLQNQIRIRMRYKLGEYIS